VIKTLVMQDEKAQPLIVLMHGDKKVSTKIWRVRPVVNRWSRASRK
jgi:prolyl-tRNA editing enzyme YbaK/EbsC (Cys-tRNA(Pro) deacylase)